MDRMRPHPGRSELFAYAEQLAAANPAIPAETARHVARCPACAAEVQRIRASLVFLESAPELTPSEEQTAQILAAARAERRVGGKASAAAVRFIVRTAKGLACAAAVLIMGAVSFRAVLTEQSAAHAASARTVLARPAVDNAPSPETIRKVSSDIRELATVLQEGNRPQSPAEWRSRRIALAVRADLAEASSALERNPGCERARRLITVNLARQADALKALYVERTL